MLLAACTGHADKGTISGHLLAVGGPAGIPNRPLSGTVSLKGSDNFQVAVGPDGSYSLSVPQGTYSVSGRSPLYQGGQRICRASHPVTVTKGAVVKADVFCQER